MIAARMRHDHAWSDASILNISSRGLLLHAAVAPTRGTYVEVRRGQHVIVARVIWSNETRFGVCAQDRLATNSIIANETVKRAPVNDAGEFVERRSRSRPERLEWRHAESRGKGRFLEFAFIAGFGLLLAGFANRALSRTLSQPLERITVRFAGTP